MPLCLVLALLVSAACGARSLTPNAAPPPTSQSSTPQHAVLVEFRFEGSDLQPLYELEDTLTAAIKSSEAGEFDGNEVGADGSAKLYMYGPDADRLFEVVRPILEATPFMRGAIVIKRYGSPGNETRESRVTIGKQ